MNTCEDGCAIDDAMELPPVPRTLTNSRIDGTFMMERMMADTHDHVSALPPDEPPTQDQHIELRDDIMHGAHMDHHQRWCSCCNAERPELTQRNELKCWDCGAPWDQPDNEEEAA